MHLYIRFKILIFFFGINYLQLISTSVGPQTAELTGFDHTLPNFNVFKEPFKKWATDLLPRALFITYRNCFFTDSRFLGKKVAEAVKMAKEPNIPNSAIAISLLMDGFPSLPTFDVDSVSRKEAKELLRDYIRAAWGALQPSVS